MATPAQQALIDMLTADLAMRGVDARYKAVGESDFSRDIRCTVSVNAVGPGGGPRLFGRGGGSAGDGHQRSTAIITVPNIASFPDSGVEQLRFGDVLELPGSALGRTEATVVVSIGQGVRPNQDVLFSGEVAL